MTVRIAHAQYPRSNGATATLVVEKYENEPDFQSYAITRFVDPHDPSVAAFAGFDVRSELVELLDGQLADAGSPEYERAKGELLQAFDRGEPL